MHHQSDTDALFHWTEGVVEERSRGRRHVYPGDIAPGIGFGIHELFYGDGISIHDQLGGENMLQREADQGELAKS